MQAVSFAADLFSQGPRTLIDDAQGGCVYHPAFIDAACAEDWFEQLRDAVEWRQWSRPMYDRVVDVPRLTASLRLASTELPDAIAEAAALVRGHLGVPFNAVGLNLYRDGRDSVAWHGDRIARTVRDPNVATISLGSTAMARAMPMRCRWPPLNSCG